MLNRSEKGMCKLHAAFKLVELDSPYNEKKIWCLSKIDMNSIAYFNDEVEF